MRKYFLIILSFSSLQSLFSQDDYEKKIRYEYDSLKKELPNLKGIEKVDCLNELVRKSFDLPLGSWKAEADTARPYAIQANNEAKRIGYKKGLGLSYVNLETIDCMMFGTYAQVQKRFDSLSFYSVQQNARNAISIGEEINDNYILGEAYSILDWLLFETRDKKYTAQRTEYSKKAIKYFELLGDKNKLARSLENWVKECGITFFVYSAIIQLF